jgi:hypothetical protein
MPVIDAAIEEARLLTPIDEDNAVYERLGRPTRRLRQLGSRLPAVRQWVIYVDPGNAPGIAAADGPNAAVDNDDREVIA